MTTVASKLSVSGTKAELLQRISQAQDCYGAGCGLCIANSKYDMQSAIRLINSNNARMTVPITLGARKP